jgi:glycosyltransferase involved in cell wall biosynthesis
MGRSYDKKAGPVVSVIIPTFNRPQYLHHAVASVLRQSYRDLQIIIVNDGGVSVGNIVNSFRDPRLMLIERDENLGKAHSLNEALDRADGKYVTYLDDDDLYYPHHIGTLVGALEHETDCKVVYSDFYKAYCQVSPNGHRKVLSKVVEVSRDFDRFFMLYFNHVLHVCLMHRRDMIEKTGRYNEHLNILIDWDMTRRLAFFSDFRHVCEITGEYYHPMGDCDRISVQRRKDKAEYLRNVLAIRTTRPPKPWEKIQDMSIILVCDRLNKQTGETIKAIWQNTFYPYKLYLPLPASELHRLNTDMPSLICEPVEPSCSPGQRVDAALKRCEGDYIAIVPDGFPIDHVWAEGSLYALMNSGRDGDGFELKGSTDRLWGAVVRRSDLDLARRRFPHLPVRESLKAAGVTLRQPDFEELPFQFDNLLQEARSLEKDGNWAEAGRMFESIAYHHQNELWMTRLAAKAFFKAGEHAKAAELGRKANQSVPDVDTLLLEARIKHRENDFSAAIELLSMAEQKLSDSHWSDSHAGFPVRTAEHEWV